MAPSERDTYGVICKGATLTPLANGFCFGEGPRWFEGLLWFSDMLGEAVHTVNLHGDMSKLPLTGHAPSGLGFRPDGSLLIASTENRQVLRYDDETVATVADLSDIVPASLGDMVVDDLGRAYVGSQAREGGVIVRVDPHETVTVVAGDLDFPNGMVITGGPRRQNADGRRVRRSTVGLTAFDHQGGPHRRSTSCTLGGPERRTLFMLSSTSAYPQRLVGTKLSRLDATTVDIPGAGLP